MKKRCIYLVLPIITLILEILPYGAVLNFMLLDQNGNPGSFRELYSYFDLMPLGYANFPPFITGILTCIILVLLLVYCIIGKQRLLIFIRNILCVTVVISVCPVLYGFHFLSIVGVLITITLGAELLLLNRVIKGKFMWRNRK